MMMAALPQTDRLLLEVSGARKAFPGVLALDGVSLRLRPGEIHALLGENGAGKSTLIKIITGLYRPDVGQVQIDGAPVHFDSPQAAARAGISVVHQERNLIPHFTVAENILLDRLPTRRFQTVDYDQVRAEARKWLDVVGLHVAPDAPVWSLSVAQMQLVEVAKALSRECRILLLDEPTATITPHEAESLFGVLRGLRERGVAILFVSHKLEEVFALCDRVTVLRDGRNVAQGEPLSELDRSRLVSLMIGREEIIRELPPRPVDRSRPLLEVSDLATESGARGVRFSLCRGEILGIYGLVGAGRTELAKALVGADAVTGGEVRVKGEPVHVRSVRDALERCSMAYISENRKEEGLILLHSVLRNTSITLWHRLQNCLQWIPASREKAAVMPFIEQLEVKTPSLAQAVGNLSGGNQQKVSLAKWLAADVEILIIDEPTVGIDIKTKHYFHELIWDLAGQGKSILLISSDMPEMIRLADRILVMRDHQVVGELDNTHQYDEISRRIMTLLS